MRTRLLRARLHACLQVQCTPGTDLRTPHTCPSLSGSGSFTLTRELILMRFVRFFFGLFFFGDLLCAGLRLAGLAEASASPSRSMGGNVNMPHQFPGRGPATHLSAYPCRLCCPSESNLKIPAFSNLEI